MKTVILNNEEVNFDACVNLMDDEIREAIHAEFASCTEQEFLDAYVDRHYDKYGEQFKI